MPKPVKKAVFPAAGRGTRMLPATRAVAKELLPVVDTPLIQYALEEAAEAGVEDFIFITAPDGAPGASSIADHFAAHFAAADKPPPGRLHYAVQPEPLGLGHAVWCARDFIGADEPFAVLLSDDLMQPPPGGPGCMAQMVQAHAQAGGNMAAVQDVPREMTARYGILDVESESADGRLVRARGLVEKPAPEDAPSTLSIVGRYILDPAVLRALDAQKTGAGGEIQLTDAMAETIGAVPFHGFRFAGRRFDCGGPAGFVQANLAFGLAREDTGAALRDFLKKAV
ncbi:MAG: UTP--glucose-1-phosphate uridylyltransferase [Rhodospirillales bacterium]